MCECFECGHMGIDGNQIKKKAVAGGCLGAKFSGTCPLCGKSSIFREVVDNKNND